MKAFTKMDLVEEFAIQANKWCIYISTIEDIDVKEVNRAIPFLSEEECYNLMDGFLVLTFDTEKLMEFHFDFIVGDDGPTPHNTYDGPVRVYALTCSNKGNFLNENT